MTVDAIGGVWRYAVDLARGLRDRGVACRLIGLGPCCDRGAEPDLVWTDLPLDWLAADTDALADVAGTLSALARDWDADLLHLNLPSQAAGLQADLPVVVASHSCVPSWWQAMRGTALPPAWAWQLDANRAGFDRADAILVPSASHARALHAVYGPLARLHVVHNATDAEPGDDDKQAFVLAAGRWWDEAKDAATLDRAARSAQWPVRMAGAMRGPGGQVVSLAYAQPLGELAPGALGELMRACAIFAAPSRYEPFGLAVLEAATQHAALLLADIPTFRELWQEAAIFVPPGDADAFAGAIDRLAGDGALRRELGQRAARIAARLRPARQLDGVVAAYAQAAARHRGAG